MRPYCCLLSSQSSDLKPYLPSLPPISSLRKAQESQKEMKLLLDMYKSAPKEQRDKVQLMAAERKAKAEVRAGRACGACREASPEAGDQSPRSSGSSDSSLLWL